MRHLPFHRPSPLASTILALLFLLLFVSSGCGVSSAPTTDTSSSVDAIAEDAESAPLPVPGAEPSSDQQTSFLAGKVIALADGDTITVLDDTRQTHKVRLEGIDAPEASQDYGTRSKEALAAKIFGQQVQVHWKERDKYDRILGHVYLGQRWINHELVAEGWAWHFKRYSSDEELATAEKAARKSKIGLWADPNEPEAPWDFRREHSAPK